MLKRAALISLLPILAAGCGGGSSSLSGSSSGQTTSVGEAKITYQGAAKPAVLNYESGLTVSSLAGVSLTGFTAEPAANLNDTTIAFLSNSNTGGASTYQHGQIQSNIISTSNVAYGLAFDHTGHLYYSGVPGSTLEGQITKAYYDGSSATSVYTSPTVLSPDIAVSPNNATIVADGNGIFAISSTGTNYVQLDTAGAEPTVSPGGTTVAYVKAGNSPTTTQIWTVPIGGGTPTQLTASNDNLSYPVYTPDGQLILAAVDNGSTRFIAAFFTGGTYKGQFFTAYTSTTSGWAEHPAISPDGLYLAYDYSATYNPATTTVVTQDAHGQEVQTIGNGRLPIWSPFPSNKTFVGSSGSLYTSAAGFVFTQIQSGFESLVAFTATTNSTATATLNSTNAPGSTGPLVYDLHADSITGIKYTNAYYDAPVSIAPGTTDALVTIDSTTGEVSLVAPFAATRGTSVTSTKTSKGLQYLARFTGVWDAHGKNLAPNGVTSLTIDPHHGNLLSF